MNQRVSRHRGKINTSFIGVGLLLVTTVASLAVVFHNVISISHPDHTVVSICHWQLEAGYRDAFDAVIKDYEALHPDVEINQIPITEQVYTPWVNTQMSAKTAPDLIEMGHSNLNTKDEYVIRFFDAIGGEVVKPNPYNAGTPMEGIAWKETFIDGMRGGFKDTLQDYFMVPTTLTSSRLYCNMSLIHDATGRDTPPTSFAELLDVCQKVRKYSLEKSGGGVVPLVSAYQEGMVIGPYLVPFTTRFEPTLDIDLDGVISVPEQYFGLMTGKISLDSPAMKAYWTAMKQLCDQMQSGFVAMDRQTAQFTFVNNRAAFLATGSWDARGTIDAAKQKNLDIKLIQWPLPKPGDPYSEFTAGRQNEAASKGGSAFGLFKYSHHKEVAIDFMRFLSSVKENEKFNQMADWPPITIGSQPSELMKPFMPDPIGYTSKVDLNIGTRVGAVLTSESESYLQGDKTLPQFYAAYTKALNDPRSGDWAVWKEYDQRWRDCRNQETVLDREAVNQLMNPNAFNPKQYQRTILQQLRRNNGADYRYMFESSLGRPLPEF